MQSDAFKRLIEVLLAGTGSGALLWDPHLGYVHSFEHKQRTGNVIVESRDGDGVAPFQLWVTDSDGKETDRFVDRDSSSHLPRLFHTIARSVRGGEAPSPVLTQVLAELERALPA